MTKKAKKKEVPTIVAITHAFWDDFTYKSSLEKLEAFFEKAAVEAKNRRLFVELDSELLNDYLKKEIDFRDGFYKAVRLAKKHGWKVVPLDKTSVVEQFQSPLMLPLRKDFLRRRYLGYNVRERSWARKLKELKAGGSDFVVMHPNHVQGFLIETGIKGKNVVWIDRPRTWIHHGPIRKRLNSKERRKLKRRNQKKSPKPAKRPR